MGGWRWVVVVTLQVFVLQNINTTVFAFARGGGVPPLASASDLMGTFSEGLLAPNIKEILI